MALRVGIIIPAYNEGGHIGNLVRELRGMSFEPIVVDDGSKDDTVKKALANGAKVKRHDRNLGKGAALKTGIAAGLKENYEAVIIMDGDAQHSPADIPRLMSAAENNPGSFVIGNRMGNAPNMPFSRKLTNKFMSFIVSSMCRQRIPDSQCGFRLIRTDFLKKITIESSRFEVESELLVKASAAGVKIVSVPIKTLYGTEFSQINPFRDAFRFIYFLLKFALKNGKRKQWQYTKQPL